MEKSYKYLWYFMLILIPLTFAGFFRTYFIQFPNFGERITTDIHLHTLIATLWIVMLIVQPILILNKKLRIHRLIGRLSYLLFPLLILSFVPQMVKMVRADDWLSLFFPVGASVLLIVFYSLAVINRKSSSHMRYMIATALVFTGPTMVRIGTILLGWSALFSLTVHYITVYLILFSLVWWDRKNNRKYKPYLIAAACFIIHQGIYYRLFL